MDLFLQPNTGFPDYAFPNLPFFCFHGASHIIKGLGFLDLYKNVSCGDSVVGGEDIELGSLECLKRLEHTLTSFLNDC